MTETADINVDELSDDQVDKMMDEYKQSDEQGESHEGQELREQDGADFRGEPSTEEPESREDGRGNADERSGEDGEQERDTEQLREDDPESRSGRGNQAEIERDNLKKALKEERERQKEIRRELAEQRDASKKLTEAFEKVVGATQPNDQEKVPSFDEDPINNMQHRLEQAYKHIEKIETSQKTFAEQQQERANMERFVNDYTVQEQNFAKEAPDYQDAKKFLQDQYKQEYMLQGMSEQEAIDALQTGEYTLAAQNMVNQKNPAKTIYELAKMRGYQGKQAASKQQETEAEKMERIAEGRKASKRISGKGEATTDRYTVEDLLSMPDSEFDKIDWERHARY